MDAVLYQGSQKDREEIRKYEFGYMSRTNVKGHKMQIVITSPETCMVPDKKSINGRSLCRALSAIQWDVIVVDEGASEKCTVLSSLTSQILALSSSLSLPRPFAHIMICISKSKKLLPCIFNPPISRPLSLHLLPMP